jgi:AbrB family looped-hinge helix DNA binding protein
MFYGEVLLPHEDGELSARTCLAPCGIAAISMGKLAIPLRNGSFPRGLLRCSTGRLYLPTGMRDGKMSPRWQMARTMTKLGEGGRLVIPSEYRKALGVETGDELVLVLEDKSIRVTTPKEGIRRAQAIIRSYIPEGVSLSEELIAERRQESELE